MDNDNNNKYEDDFEIEFDNDPFDAPKENLTGFDFEDITSSSGVTRNEMEGIPAGPEDISSNSEDITSFETDHDISSSRKNSIDLNSFATKEDEKRSSKKDKKKKKTTKQRIIKIVLSTFLIGVIVVSLVIGAFVLYAFTMIDGTMPQDLNDLKLNFTTTIYVKDNATGQFVEYQRLHGEFNRIWVEYDAKAAKDKKEGYLGIPQQLVNAFVAIEDKRFYSHYGIDWKRTTAAFINMFLHFYSSDQGGSTITQQLVKNLTADDEKKASRKLREIMRARYLESHYSKDTIMECYLNVISLGHGMSGVGVASNYYFNKNVSDLTLAECATIAAITKSPTKYAPDVNPKENKRRRQNVLKEMYDQGYITKKEYDAALKEDVKIVANSDNVKEKKVNSYAVDAIIRQVTRDLAKKNNYDTARASKDFYNGGYKIYTTIDPSIQATVDKVFSDSNTYGLVGANGEKLQGSFTMLDYKGDVIALSGGIGEKTVNLEYNRATDAKRQPGSTMKPIAAYAPAIEKKLVTYSTIYSDVPESYGNWTPHNWYTKNKGMLTIQRAIECSTNGIPVKIVNQLTPEFCYEFLTQKLGISTLTTDDINLPSLGLGGTHNGLCTMESAAAYATFGNGGDYYKPCLYYKVCDQYDNVVLENEQKPTYAMSSDTATVMNKMLQSVVDGGEGTGGRMRTSYFLDRNMKIYAKTGTSNDSKDLWFVGGTPYYVASCWCGYDKQQQAIPSTTIALKMWGVIMSEVHKNLPAKDFEISSDAKSYYYCTATGNLATDQCPSKAVGWYRKNGTPKVCTSHSGTALPAIETKTEEKKAS